MKKKVLLINPRKGWRPALGLLYIAAYVRDAGYEVRIFEFIDEDFFPGQNKSVWKKFHAYDPDFIGLGVISWNRRVAKDIIQRIRKETHDKVIVCGGKDPNFKPDFYLENGVDYVIFGEGETPMVDLLDTLTQSDRILEEVNGIGFLRDGQVYRTTSAPLLSLDNLKFPALDLVDFDHYANIRLGGIPGHFIKTGFMMASRGCPYTCRFCTDPIRVRYRERSIDHIIAEIKWQMETWHIDGMVFLDDLFYYRDDRVDAFCERILKEGIKLKFYAQARADRVGSPETLTLMKKAGFLQIAIGVESGSQRMLDIMDKRTQLQTMKDAVNKVENAGIFSYIFLVVGFPEENLEDLMATEAFLKEVQPSFTTVNYFMPMPGTEYFNEDDKKALEELTFSLTENQSEFHSSVPYDEIMRYRNTYLSLAKRNANFNLLRYPAFYWWVFKLMLFRPMVLLRGVYKQKTQRSYTSYFEAVRTAMINNRIFGV
ncbi:MAG: Protein involved in methylthiolation of isopentenylated A37 derivatives in tRNA [Magnetococcales bacterium]|nr:Protein involved in methylthiolation of isopentenylated A37 derivatives in tRNA [Magnetococcales bacterium]